MGREASVTELELIEDLGYRLADIENALEPEQYQEFCKWFYGQTGAISSTGELLIYPWDFYRFMKGGPDKDIFD